MLSTAGVCVCVCVWVGVCLFLTWDHEAYFTDNTVTLRAGLASDEHYITL